MRLGVNQFCFPAEYDAERCLQLAAGAGFAGFELNVTEPVAQGGPAQLTLASTETETRRLAERAGSLGLQLHSLSTALHWTYPLTAADARTRDKGVAIAERMIELARLIGAETVLIVPGLVTGEVSYKAAYERALDAMQHLSITAERAGVVIGVENVWNKFLLSPLEMRRFIEEVGSEHVGAYLDAGNVLAFGYPEHWVEALGGLIRQVHVKDFRLDVGNICGFAPLGHGDVPWSRLLAALREVGYDGYLTVELPPRRHLPDEGVRESARSLRAITEL